LREILFVYKTIVYVVLFAHIAYIVYILNCTHSQLHIKQLLTNIIAHMSFCIHDVMYVLHTINCTHIAYTMMLHTAHYTHDVVMTFAHIHYKQWGTIVQSYMSLQHSAWNVESFTFLWKIFLKILHITFQNFYVNFRIFQNFYIIL